jgi:hypothetical protein
VQDRHDLKANIVTFMTGDVLHRVAGCALRLGTILPVSSLISKWRTREHEDSYLMRSKEVRIVLTLAMVDMYDRI